MNNFKFELQGASQMAANLGTLSVTLQRRIMRQALVDGAAPLRASMMRHAPRGDPEAPNLADSIAIQPGRRPSVAVGPTRDIDYARHNEFGTIYKSAHSFMRVAVDESARHVWPIAARTIRTELLERGLGSVRAGSTGGGLL